MKFKNNNLAVSEVMGTILIMCVTVPFITSVYLATMALPPPSETPIVDIVGMTIEEDNNIVFSNQGGNELPIEKTKLALVCDGDLRALTGVVEGIIKNIINPIIPLAKRGSIPISVRNGMQWILIDAMTMAWQENTTMIIQ